MRDCSLQTDGTGCYLFAFAYLFCGVNILASGIFTALSDGRTSALISFLRTFVFIVISVLVLPYFLGTDGVWLSIPLAEILTLTVSLTHLAAFLEIRNGGNKKFQPKIKYWRLSKF